MAVLRILSLCMLLCCSEAMFKKDMRTVMEEEWPDMKHLGDVVSQATDKAKAIVHQGQEAVEGIKDLALDTFEAAAAKVNQSLKVVGQEVRDMNTTAMKEIISLDDKVKSAKNKAATFAAGTSAVLEQIQPIFEQFLEQLHSVTKMATDALNSISQEKAVMSLDKAMDKVFATASSWKFAMQDLAEKLQQMNESLSGYTPEEKVERPGAARRHERQADRQASRADSNLTNSTEPKPTVAALVQSMAMDPVEELSKTLKGPMKELKSAAAKLNDMAEEVTGAMGSFVDGALEAAKSKLPKSLMANVTEVLKGVQHEAMQELEPLGELGQSIVSGLKKAGTDAGLDFDSGLAARLPLTLLMGLAMGFIGFA